MHLQYKVVILAFPIFPMRLLSYYGFLDKQNLFNLSSNYFGVTKLKSFSSEVCTLRLGSMDLYQIYRIFVYPHQIC